MWWWVHFLVTLIPSFPTYKWGCDSTGFIQATWEWVSWCIKPLLAQCLAHNPQINVTCCYLFPLFLPIEVLFIHLGPSQVPAPRLWALPSSHSLLASLWCWVYTFLQAKRNMTSPWMSLQSGGKGRRGNIEREWSKAARDEVEEGRAKRSISQLQDLKFKISNVVTLPVLSAQNPIMQFFNQFFISCRFLPNANLELASGMLCWLFQHVWLNQGSIREAKSLWAMG